MNPEVQVGPFTSAAFPPATPMSRLQPPPTMPCPSSPRPAHQIPRTTPTHTNSTFSSPTAPTVTPLNMICGPVTAGVPVRSRTFRVTEPGPSLSSVTFWVGSGEFTDMLLLGNIGKFCTVWELLSITVLNLRLFFLAFTYQPLLLQSANTSAVCL